MKTSFTNFKLSFGIKETTDDVEYSQIMLGVLRELYSTYGIALLRDIETKSEDLILYNEVTTQLIHKNIKTISMTGYIENVDYIVNYEEGTITSLSSGSIIDGTTVTVEYTYYVFVNESDNLILEIYPYNNKTKYNIGINPYTLNSVSYGGSPLVENISFYHYNGIFEIPSVPTNLRLPYILNLNVGFDEIPNDLKMAFYELIKLRYDRRKQKADLITRVEDNSGTTTSYRDGKTPTHIERIFSYYTGRSFASA